MEEKISLWETVGTRASCLAKIYAINSQVYRQMQVIRSLQHSHVNTLFHKQAQLWFLTECPV